MLSNLTKSAVAGIAALSIAAGAAAPAHALGKNERNFLKGVAATLIISKLLEEANKPAYAAPAQRYYVPNEPVRRAAPTHSYYQTPVASAFGEYSSASKRAIQQRLRAYGYYSGAIDGVFGPGTRRAIELYARDSGNPAALQSRDGTVRLLNGLLT